MKELVHSMTLIFSRKKMSEELKKKGDRNRQFFYKPVWKKFFTGLLYDNSENNPRRRM